VAVVLVVGLLICLTGVVLLFDVFGAGDFVIRKVTSRYLGSLPPGFAASKRGFCVYASLVLAIGVLFLGFALAAWIVLLGFALLVFGALAFIATSVIAIRGEAETARRLRS
jgi:hypothetical protein